MTWAGHEGQAAFLDGAAIGVVPASGIASAGTHEVAVRDGFVEVGSTVTLAPGVDPVVVDLGAAGEGAP